MSILAIVILKLYLILPFGTHYASITELGTKLSIERRYSAKVMRTSGLRGRIENISNQERGSTNTGELEQCNTLVGSKIFGFQAEMARYNCTKDNLLSKGFHPLKHALVSCTGLI